jgi:hypothetical protein
MMNLITASSSIATILGLSCLVSCKLTHIFEFARNKMYGDTYFKSIDWQDTYVYKKDSNLFNLGKRISIACLSALITYQISSIALKLLFGASPLGATALLISSAAVPILMGIIDSVIDSDTQHIRGVYLSPAELLSRGINSQSIEPRDDGTSVYTRFGMAPQFIPGRFTNDWEYD